MKSNYKSLENYIREVNSINTDLSVKYLRGISSIYKSFIRSRANIVGVDFLDYKIVRKGQFAFNPNTARMGDKIPIALNETEDCIVSKIYPVFEIRDTNELLPEYLMMWFRRPEFDRYARFKSHGSAREIFDWREMCNTLLPIPSITKQREIVKEYNVIQNRISLNQMIIQKLEESAQTVYSQWFVEFEFPDANGKPYKKSGGAMVFNIELEKEIPKDWKYGHLGDIINVINGYAFSSSDFNVEGNYPIIKIANIIPPDVELESAQYFSGELNNSMKKGIVEYGDIIISMTGSHMNQIDSAVGKIGRYNYDVPAILNQRVSKLKPKFNCVEFLFHTMLKEETQKEILMAATGSANQANISPVTIKDVRVIIPPISVLNLSEEYLTKIYNQRNNFHRQNRKLEYFKSLLLSKIASVEN